MQEDNIKITFYTPENSANIQRISFVEETLKNDETEGTEETEETKKKKWVGIEYNCIVEQSYPVPLKALKRVKQTKSEEFFYIEEIVKVKQPLMQKVTEEEEITKLINYLEQSVI